MPFDPETGKWKPVLEQVKDAVSRYFPCYVDMLRWQQHGNVITAVPKRQLSDQAFSIVSRVFKRLGGRYVRRQGTSYFELVVKVRAVHGLEKKKQGNL